MKSRDGSSFARALNSVEGTLTASHIAEFPVQCCGPEDDIESVRRSIAEDASDFSHVPIRIGGRIASVVHRSKIGGARGEAIHHGVPLRPGDVIESACPLREAILRLRERGFLLVRSPESGYEDQISGIINDADVQKLPVRLLLFAHITEIETRLRSIVASVPWEKLPGGPGADRTAEEIREKWSDKGLPKIHYLNLTQLGHLASQAGKFRIDGKKGAALTRHLKELKDIRNAVAHSSELGKGKDRLGTIQAVMDALELVEQTVEALR